MPIDKKEPNPSDAHQAFEDLAAARQSVLDLEPIPLFSAAGRVLTALSSLCALVSQPEQRARFSALPNFDLFVLDNLYAMGLAYWYASVKLKEARVAESQAQVEPRVKAQAEETKRRMFSLIEYQLAGDARVLRQLADIRSGSGYEDLATDLMRLAGLHEKHNELLQQDNRNYRQADPELARNLATRILSDSTATRVKTTEKWAAETQLSATHLSHSYTQLCAAATWLYWQEPDSAARFISIRGLGRGRRKAARSPAPPVEDTAAAENNA